ncbi:MAG TPA: type II toxin-antitoxin system VapC family toxin [Anaerolineae bacterium]
MKYLLDTNVISELVAKQPNPRVIRWIDQLEPDGVFLSVITIGELSKGIERLPSSKRKETLYGWLRDDLLLRFSGRILTLDIDVMLTWGTLTGQLEHIGKPLSAMDSLIAALALYHHCSLATRNIEHFKQTEVSLVNPWDIRE